MDNEKKVVREFIGKMAQKLDVPAEDLFLSLNNDGDFILNEITTMRRGELRWIERGVEEVEKSYCCCGNKKYHFDDICSACLKKIELMREFISVINTEHIIAYKKHDGSIIFSPFEPNKEFHLRFTVGPKFKETLQAVFHDFESEMDEVSRYSFVIYQKETIQNFIS